VAQMGMDPLQAASIKMTQLARTLVTIAARGHAQVLLAHLSSLAGPDHRSQH
jgi:hypothetical protein